MKHNFYIIIFIFLALSCEKKTKSLCSKYNMLMQKKYDELYLLDKNKNSKLFKIKYDSTNYYLDKYMECNPNSVELIRYKLGLLSYNKDYKKMIPFYNKLLLSDSLSIQDKRNVKYSKFCYMLMTDSIKHKKEIKNYYKEVNQQEPKVSELLKNLSKNELEIYKRLKLSYYFEGREKTLEDFR